MEVFSILREIADVLNNLLLPVALFIAKLLIDIKGDLRDYQIMFFGKDGQNGWNSDIKALRESEHTHGNRLQELYFRLDVAERDLAELKERLNHDAA